MRAIGFAAVMALAASAASPALGQDVLHAILLYHYRAPFAILWDFPPAEPARDIGGAGASFFARCVLPIGDKVCVHLWTLNEKSRYPRQGMSLLNLTHQKIAVRLEGCEVHNGRQTIVIDPGEKGRIPPKPGPFEEIIDEGDALSVAFLDPQGRSIDSIPGMRKFQEGVRLTCRIATATQALP